MTEVDRPADLDVDAAGATLPLGATRAADDQRGRGVGDRGEPHGAPTTGAGGVSRGHSADYLELIEVDAAHYVIEGPIAQGGMGRILVARDRRLGRPVAIKELLDHDEDARARFEREARITARLQHPGIVNILEAGTWSDGEPFYVMKLVTGESLDRAIAGRATLEGRLGLLAHVISAVDALAYAHSTRIIHRDLKPANVLVGGFGETVVIDWGLAKDLTAAGPEPAAGPYRVGSGATVSGSIMGTPAYMPVEQARGEPVDERADVYALGAMVYHLLAGQPPYRGDGPEATLEAVIAGPPPTLAACAEGVPADLVAIVDKAMARDARDRYRDAGELAADLKRFQTGQLVGAHRYTSWQLVRRWLRRHRAAVAVAAAAALVLAAVGAASVVRIVREQARTERQRRQAVVSRAEAEDILTFMLGDLRDKLRPLNRLDLLDDVATKAISHYRRRGSDLADDELGRLALGHRNLGDVLQLRGKSDPALAQYEASYEIARELVGRAPGNVEWLWHLEMSLLKLGAVRRVRGDEVGALERLRAAEALAELVAARDPSNPSRQQDRVVARERIGDALLAQGEWEAALVEFQASRVVAERLAASEPDNPARQRQVSVGHEKVGDVLRTYGELPRALEAFRASARLRDALLARDPGNAELRRDRAIAHDRVGTVLRDQGDLDGALAEYRSFLAIIEPLAAQDPDNARLAADLAFAHTMIGNIHRTRGALAPALASFRATLAIQERLARLDPDALEPKRGLIIAQNKIGLVLYFQDDFAGALAMFRTALAAAQDLASRHPDYPPAPELVSISQSHVGDALLELGDRAGALVAFRADLAKASELASRHPEDSDLQGRAALALAKVGDVLLAGGAKDAAEALALLRRAEVIAKKELDRNPSDADRKHELADAEGKVGDALRAMGDRAGARATYEHALGLAREVADKQGAAGEIGELVQTLERSLATCCGAARRGR